MTKKTLAVCVGLLAALATAAPAAAAKTPKTPGAYVDNDGSGSWSTGDTNLETLFKKQPYYVAPTTGRAAAADIVIDKLAVRGVGIIVGGGDITVGDQVTGRGNRSGQGLYLTAPHGTVEIAAGANISVSNGPFAIDAETIRVGEGVTIAHKETGPGRVSIAGGDITIASGVSMTSIVKDKTASPGSLFGSLSIIATERLALAEDVKIVAPKSYVNISGPKG